MYIVPEPFEKANCSSKMSAMSAPEVPLRLIDRFDRNLYATRSEHDQTAFQRQIAATDRQIDRLVYELYGLSEEEIEISQGNH